MLAARFVRYTAATIALILMGLGMVVLLSPYSGPAALMPATMGHFLLFLALGLTLGVWWAAGPTRNAVTDLAMLLGGLLLFASGSEVGQIWVDGRTPQTGDWLADAAGTVAGLSIGAAVTLLLTGRSHTEH